MSAVSVRKIYYAGIVVLWLILMSMLIHKHYGSGGRDTFSQTSVTADFFERTAVRFTLTLPENTSYLRVRISGVDFSQLDLAGGRQRLDGSTLTIQRDPPKEEPDDELHSPNNKYLEESFTVKPKDPATAALAREIVREEHDPARAARLINDWVYRNIEKVRTVSVPVSSDVLKTRKGDCNEHAALFTALARAAGIPSRIALGLVYGDGSLYYHAWSEIMADGWTAVDPTLGQFPADAGHIRLINGDLDKQAMILSLIGRIQVEGLEFRTGHPQPQFQ